MPRRADAHNALDAGAAYGCARSGPARQNFAVAGAPEHLANNCAPRGRRRQKGKGAFFRLDHRVRRCWPNVKCGARKGRDGVHLGAGGRGVQHNALHVVLAEVRVRVEQRLGAKIGLELVPRALRILEAGNVHVRLAVAPLVVALGVLRKRLLAGLVLDNHDADAAGFALADADGINFRLEGAERARHLRGDRHELLARERPRAMVKVGARKPLLDGLVVAPFSEHVVGHTPDAEALLAAGGRGAADGEGDARARRVLEPGGDANTALALHARV